MKDKTTMRMVGGTWYLRLPPAFARHIGLGEANKNDIIEAEKQDEIGKHGNYISGWKKEKIQEDNSTNKLDSIDYKDTYKKCSIEE